MALKKCKECGKKISTEASVCPHCGVPEPTTIDKTKKSLSKGDKFLLIFFILPCVLLAIITSSFDEGDSSYTNNVVLTAEEQAEQAREDLISNAFSAWDGSHIDLTRVVKESMNDPSSYEHVETTYIDNGQTLFNNSDYLLVIMEFSGTNAFGGRVRNVVRAKTSIETGKVVEILSQD